LTAEAELFSWPAWSNKASTEALREEWLYFLKQ
jgi:hypothetical protein